MLTSISSVSPVKPTRLPPVDFTKTYKVNLPGNDLHGKFVIVYGFNRSVNQVWVREVINGHVGTERALLPIDTLSLPSAIR